MIMSASVLFVLLVSGLLTGAFLSLSEKKGLDREKCSPYECGFEAIGGARSSFSVRFFFISGVVCGVRCSGCFVNPVNLYDCSVQKNLGGGVVLAVLVRFICGACPWVSSGVFSLGDMNLEMAFMRNELWWGSVMVGLLVVLELYCLMLHFNRGESFKSGAGVAELSDSELKEVVWVSWDKMSSPGKKEGNLEKTKKTVAKKKSAKKSAAMSRATKVKMSG